MGDNRNVKYDAALTTAKHTGIAILIIIVIIAFLRLFYIVPVGSEAILFSFGTHTEKVGEGLHFKAPWVRKIIYDIQEVHRFEFGETTLEVGKTGEIDQNIMKTVTADTKILLISWVLQWKIGDPYQYWLVNNRDEKITFNLLGGLAESEFRKTVANFKYEDILTGSKNELMIQAKQRIVTEYNKLGVGITVADVLISEVKVHPSVQPSYDEVESANQDKSAKINEAEKFANQLIETAKGNAQVAINEGKEYKVRKLTDSQVMASRLNALVAMNNENPKLVRTNLWHDSMRKILKNLDITIVDDKTNIFINGIPVTNIPNEAIK
jgi:membrane protease subunit HflK